MTKHVDQNGLFDLQQGEKKIVAETISNPDPNSSMAFLNRGNVDRDNHEYQIYHYDFESCG